MNPPRSIETTIMDLNDDCVLEILKHLTLDELADVADVSSRLRGVAEQRFVDLKVTEQHYWDGSSLLQKARYLRNFGKFIKTFTIENDEMGKMPNEGELFSRYTSPTDMTISRIIIFEDGFCPLRALLPRLKRLSLFDCCFNVEILEILANGALQLETLFIDWMSSGINGLSLSASPLLQFRALKTIDLYGLNDPYWLADFVFPQLESFRVQLHEYTTRTHSEYVEIIARCAPSIKTLDFETLGPNGSTDISNIGKFGNLKSLSLFLHQPTISCLVNALNELLAHNISLEILKLKSNDGILNVVDPNSHEDLWDTFVTAICKMSSLKKFSLVGFDRMFLQDHLRICGALPNLSEASFRGHGFRNIDIPIEHVLDIIRVSKNLETLWYPYGRIDATAFQRMVDAVGDDRKQLTIRLGYGSNGIDVPQYLLEKYDPKLCLKYSLTSE